MNFPRCSFFTDEKAEAERGCDTLKVVSPYSVGRGSQPVPAPTCPPSFWPSAPALDLFQLTGLPSLNPPPIKAGRLSSHSCHQALGILQKKRFYFFILKKSVCQVFSFSFLDCAVILYLRVLCLTRGHKDFLLCFLLEVL